jgi:uncharacterized protein YgiM (DUF1202 family)
MEATPHRALASRYPHLSMITAAFLIASLVLGVSTHSATPVQAQEFAAGDGVVVFADMLNVRSASGLSADIKTVVPSGTTFSITSGPVAEDGYDWYFVSYTSGNGTGWVAGEYLTLSGVETSYTIGDMVFINSDAVNFRRGAGLDAGIFTQVPLGTEFTIASGATTVDGYDWYEVSNVTGYGTGWVAGEFLDLGGSGGGADQFVSTDRVVATAFLNIRNGAGMDATIFRTAHAGEDFAIMSGPSFVDGFTWYLVASSTEEMPLSGDTGWVAGEFLTYTAVP